MNEFSTPMMRQYMEIKKECPDCLLFFRMGDFYELFMEDALTGSKILNIALTGKSGGKDGRIPMAGVPYHAADTYITKLVKAGYKVAICEQLSPPTKKGLVKRGIVRIVTPGTLLEMNSLENKENNFIISLITDDNSYALAIADLSTGYFAVKEETTTDTYASIMNDLASLKPSECLIPEALYENPEFLKLLHGQKNMNIFAFNEFPTHISESKKLLKNHFQVATLDGFGIADYRGALTPAAGLLTYLKKTQNGNVSHIKRIVPYETLEGVKLDRSTMINLELFATIREQDPNGSLLSILDHTQTAMGGRLLKAWMKKPLTDKEKIEARLNAVSYFSEDAAKRDAIREKLKTIPDIERILTRLSVNLGNARDILQLKHALKTVLTVKSDLSDTSTPLLTEQMECIPPELEKIIHSVETIFVEEPPLTLREGGLIRTGIDIKLDTIRDSITASKSWIKDLEKRERERTKISSLKVTFNKVFGFYIEVTRANAHLVPDNYIRKQTLVHAERYITDELKKHEEIILSAEEEINDIEYKIYITFLHELSLYTDNVQNAAHSIAVIDVLTNFSCIAEKYRYAKPTLLYSGEIRIKEGRHPVVEHLLDEIRFVPNDVTLDNTSQSLLIITGPNMAGKSVLIRQVAITVLMAQMGCFVPASSAHISIVDRIFVRSGASDFITSGLSTFMVEMVETADILNNATGNSLIIMDEIGRGTSTYDGISLAWAVAEFLVSHHSPPPKVLFATHYHELQALEKKYPSQIKNFHMAVSQQHGDPVFLHSLLQGGASHSFGVSVAKLAGIPETVLERANDMLKTLEGRHLDTSLNLPEVPYLDSGLIERVMLRELESIDIGTMTPLKALNFLAVLKEKYMLLSETPEAMEKD